MTRDDSGFTVIELLVAVLILAVITVPLGDALIGFLRNSDNTTRRLNESHDAQVSAAYFAQDVAAVGTRDWTAAPYPLKQSIELAAPAGGGVHPCGPAGTPPAIVRFAWDDPTDASGSPQVVRVAYVVETVGAERQLKRITCVGASTSINVLAHNVATTAPTVTCSTTCTAAPDVPQSVTMTLTIQDPDSSDPYLITLTGQRRQT